MRLGKYIDGELRTHLQKTRLAELVIFSGMKLEKLDDLQGILNRGQVRVVIAAGLLALALKKADADLAGIPFEMGVAGSQKESKIYIPPERIEQAKAMLTGARKNGVEFVLPVDFILGSGQPSDTIPADGAQFDVGPKTMALHACESRRVHQVITSRSWLPGRARLWRSTTASSASSKRISFRTERGNSWTSSNE